MIEYTDIETLKGEAKAWRKLYEHVNECSNKMAMEYGELTSKLEYVEYCLEKARREYAQLTGIYDPEWVKLNIWEIIQAHSEHPQYILPIPKATEIEANDILNLFKQSSKGV